MIALLMLAVFNLFEEVNHSHGGGVGGDINNQDNISCDLTI